MSGARDGTGLLAGELATELRRLWAAAELSAGCPLKVGAVAKRLHLSKSSLYAYRNGTTLPSLVVLDQILHELGVGSDDLKRMAELREAADDIRRTGRERSGAADNQPAKPVERLW